MDLIGHLGRFFAKDNVEVSARVITFLVVIPLEALFTGLMVPQSLVITGLTALLMLTTSDAFKRAQWQIAHLGIEVNAERRIGDAASRSLIGLFDSQLLKRMFHAMDSELSAFCDRHHEQALFDQKLELMTNLGKVRTGLGLAAAGVVLGVFDASQFLLILFVSGRLIAPLRSTLRVWLVSSRTVQGLQLFERVLKRSAKGQVRSRETSDMSLVERSLLAISLVTSLASNWPVRLSWRPCHTSEHALW